MEPVRDVYVKTLQNYQDRKLIQASIWTFRTIRDLKSVKQKSEVLTTANRVAIFFRGMMAVSVWLPVNTVAIPYTFGLGLLGKKESAGPQLHQITEDLYLGTDQAARSADILKDKNITAVLSILDFDIEVPDEVTRHKRIAIEDYPHVDLTKAIKEAKAFVKKARKNNQKILVHCNMGMSRSASIMVALVQDILDKERKDAIDYVKEKRPVIDINYGFKKQLKAKAHKTASKVKKSRP